VQNHDHGNHQIRSRSNTVFYSDQQAEYMELSENERQILVGIKKEIYQITAELLTENISNTEKMTKLNKILSLLSTIESYAKPDRDLSVFPTYVTQIMVWIESGMDVRLRIAVFCTAVNSIKFDFTKKGLKISIPIKIEAILNKMQFG
jgi:hypothetical protein